MTAAGKAKHTFIGQLKLEGAFTPYPQSGYVKKLTDYVLSETVCKVPNCDDHHLCVFKVTYFHDANLDQLVVQTGVCIIPRVVAFPHTRQIAAPISAAASIARPESNVRESSSLSHSTEQNSRASEQDLETSNAGLTAVYTVPDGWIERTGPQLGGRGSYFNPNLPEAMTLRFFSYYRTR